MLGSIGLAVTRLAVTRLAGIWLAGIWRDVIWAGGARLGSAAGGGTRRGAARGPLWRHPALPRWCGRLLLLGLPVGGLGDTGFGRSGRYDVPRHLCSSRPPRHTVYRRTIRYVPGSVR